jgi:hypothetical protein
MPVDYEVIKTRKGEFIIKVNNETKLFSTKEAAEAWGNRRVIELNDAAKAPTASLPPVIALPDSSQKDIVILKNQPLPGSNADWKEFPFATIEVSTAFSMPPQYKDVNTVSNMRARAETALGLRFRTYKANNGIIWIQRLPDDTPRRKRK